VRRGDRRGRLQLRISASVKFQQNPMPRALPRVSRRCPIAPRALQRESQPFAAQSANSPYAPQYAALQYEQPRYVRLLPIVPPQPVPATRARPQLPPQSVRRMRPLLNYASQMVTPYATAAVGVRSNDVPPSTCTDCNPGAPALYLPVQIGSLCARAYGVTDWDGVY